VETAGIADWSVFQRLQPLVDLWLYDFTDRCAKMIKF
jgi:pyruvate-formate lyase-activating enzyme